MDSLFLVEEYYLGSTIIYCRILQYCNNKQRKGRIKQPLLASKGLTPVDPSLTSVFDYIECREMWQEICDRYMGYIYWRSSNARHYIFFGGCQRCSVLILSSEGHELHGFLNPSVIHITPLQKTSPLPLFNPHRHDIIIQTKSFLPKLFFVFLKKFIY